MKKKLTTTIFLYNLTVVSDPVLKKVISEEPLSLAKSYDNHHADEIIIFDLADTLEMKEKHIDLIKEICENVQIPVIGCNYPKRMEDVKKLLYAGCAKALVSLDHTIDEGLIREVSLKFGKEKVGCIMKSTRPLLSHCNIIEEYFSEIIYCGKSDLKEALHLSSLPVLAWLTDVSLDKLIETLAKDQIIGACGEMINDSIKELESLKMLLNSNGIPMAALEASLCFEEFKKNSDGMVPVVVQDDKTDQVLMLAYMNKQAYEKTLATGK